MKTLVWLDAVTTILLVVVSLWLVFQERYGEAGIVLALASFSYTNLIMVLRQ